MTEEKAPETQEKNRTLEDVVADLTAEIGDTAERAEDLAALIDSAIAVGRCVQSSATPPDLTVAAVNSLAVKTARVAMYLSGGLQNASRVTERAIRHSKEKQFKDDIFKAALTALPSIVASYAEARASRNHRHSVVDPFPPIPPFSPPPPFNFFAFERVVKHLMEKHGIGLVAAVTEACQILEIDPEETAHQIATAEAVTRSDTAETERVIVTPPPETIDGAPLIAG